MRQHHPRDPGRVVGFGARQPPQFGDGERRDRDATDGIGPWLCAAKLVDQVGGVRCRAGVVPQQRGAHDLTAIVKHHHPVLLARDRQRFDALQQACRGCGQRVPPRLRLTLGAVRMG